MIIKLDEMTESVLTINQPGEAEKDTSGMTSTEIETAVMQIVSALDYFRALLEILEACTFPTPTDKEKAERLVHLTNLRIGWALEVFSSLKPVN